MRLRLGRQFVTIAIVLTSAGASITGGTWLQQPPPLEGIPRFEVDPA
jgi:hypothetical protein